MDLITCKLDYHTDLSCCGFKTMFSGLWLKKFVFGLPVDEYMFLQWMTVLVSW